MQPAAQQFERVAGAPRVRDEQGVVELGQLERAGEPAAELGGDRGVLQDADAVEVLEVVDGVGDVVGGVHHGGLDGLLPAGEAAGERLAGLDHVVELGDVDGELARPGARLLLRLGRAARRVGHVARVRVGVRAPGPRVLQHRGAHGGGEVEPDRAGPAGVGGGDDPQALRVALEAVGQAEPVPGEPVELLLAEVAERRVAEVVGEPGRLDDVRVAAAELVEQRGEPGVGGHPLGDRAADLGDLEAVGEPVVQQPGAAGADDLGDAAEPGEEGRRDDPVPVGPEGAGGEVARRPARSPCLASLTHAPGPYCAGILAVTDVVVAGAGPAGLGGRAGVRAARAADRAGGAAPGRAVARDVRHVARRGRAAAARGRVRGGPGRGWSPARRGGWTASTRCWTTPRCGRRSPTRTSRCAPAGSRTPMLAMAPVVVDATGAPGPRRGGADGVRGAGAGVGGRAAGRTGRRGVHGLAPAAPGPATFLYAVPLPDGRVLLEETSLARRPGLPFAELRDRLLARLAGHGIDPGDADVERVRFPVDAGPVAGSGRVVAFGAAAGLTHPATGYGVADALRLAPRVADAIATGGAAAARRVVWPARARAVHRLRRAGLATLLALPAGAHRGVLRAVLRPAGAPPARLPVRPRRTSPAPRPRWRRCSGRRRGRCAGSWRCPGFARVAGGSA